MFEDPLQVFLELSAPNAVRVVVYNGCLFLISKWSIFEGGKTCITGVLLLLWQIRDVCDYAFDAVCSSLWFTYKQSWPVRLFHPIIVIMRFLKKRSLAYQFSIICIPVRMSILLSNYVLLVNNSAFLFSFFLFSLFPNNSYSAFIYFSDVSQIVFHLYRAVHKIPFAFLTMSIAFSFNSTALTQLSYHVYSLSVPCFCLVIVSLPILQTSALCSNLVVLLEY